MIARQRAKPVGVIGEDEGQRADGAGADDPELGPGEEESGLAAEGLREEDVIAARFGVGRRQFGVAQGADERKHRANYPNSHEPAHVGDLLGDQWRAQVDTRTDDDPDDDRGRIQQGHVLARRRLERLVFGGGGHDGPGAIGGLKWRTEFSSSNSQFSDFDLQYPFRRKGLQISGFPLF